MKENHNHPLLKIMFAILLILFSLLLYSRFISTSGLKIKEYKIVNTNIPDTLNGFKIVHISDIHYGRIINSKRLEQIVERINLINPDIVVLTGDLIDRDTQLTEEDSQILIDILSKINVTIDKYAIKGNHDYFFESWENIIIKSGFVNLNNTYELIYKNGYTPILITGLSSMSDSRNIQERYAELTEEIKEKEIQSIYNILLVHEPDVVDTIDIQNYQLILGGHSHNGQVRLPVIGAIVTPDGAKKYYDEYYRINNTDLYISSGLGTSQLDFRFFNKPSFNFYRITNK